MNAPDAGVVRRRHPIAPELALDANVPAVIFGAIEMTDGGTGLVQTSGRAEGLKAVVLVGSDRREVAEIRAGSL